MRKYSWLFILVALVVIVVAVSWQQAEEAPPFASAHPKALLEESAREGRPVLLEFYATW